MKRYMIEADWGFVKTITDILDSESTARMKAKEYSERPASAKAYKVTEIEMPEDPDERFLKAVERLTAENCCIDDEGRRSIHICWGDWKHEHLRADYVMELYGFEKVGEEVDEEDGGDAYSAWRYYREVQHG